MAMKLYDSDSIQAIASAIRTQDQNSDLMTVNDMPLRIASLNGGGGLIEKSANFYDYDGTLVASYSKAQIDVMTALPSNPSHTGLTAQGWNWTLAQIKSYLTSYPNAVITIGQMYVTTSGATQIDVEFDDENYLSPYLVLAVKGTVTIDWGDNSTVNTVTGTNLSTNIFTQHTYSTIGKYTIKINVSSGNFTFYGSSNNGGVLHTTNNNSSEYYKVYCNYIKKIRLGTGITTLSNYGFQHCHNLKTITMPNTITSFGNYIFAYCFNLFFVTIPSGITSLTSTFMHCHLIKNIAVPTSSTAFSSSYQYCYSLKNIIIPTGTTYLGSIFSNCISLKNIIIPNTVQTLDTCFSYTHNLENIQIPNSVTMFKGPTMQLCYGLTNNIVIPSGTTHISSSMFQSCYKIKKITFSTPSTVRGIGNYAFQNCYSITEIQIPSGTTIIGTNAFTDCHSLEKVVIPGTVSTIGANAFSNCYNVKEYHIQATTPPGAPATTIFKAAGSTTKFYVPTASVNTYKANSIFSKWADQIYGE